MIQDQTNQNNQASGVAGQFGGMMGQRDVFQHPEDLLGAILQSMGVAAPRYSTAYGAFQDVANLAPVLGWMQSAGQPGLYNAANTLNNMQNFMTSQMNLGGGPGYNALGGFNQVFGAKPNSLLGGYLTAGQNPDQQIKNASALINAGASAGMDPMSASVLKNLLALEGDAYRSRYYQGQTPLGQTFEQALQADPNSVFHNFGTPFQPARNLLPQPYNPGGAPNPLLQNAAGTSTWGNPNFGGAGAPF